MEATLLKRLDWESCFFNMECGQFYPSHTKFEPTSNVEFEKFDWVQGRCFINDEASKRVFAESGFTFEDVRVTFEKKVKKSEVILSQNNISIRPSKPSDLEKLQKIAAKELAKHSRFCTLVGKKLAEKFYAKWIENAINKTFDDICFTLLEGRNPIGFISLKNIDINVSKIGLLGIKKEFQGKKLGLSLLHFAENYVAERNCKILNVATEGRNIYAQKFYIKQGFNIKDMECWYYHMRKSSQ